MIEFFNALLGANFDKLSFISGLILLSIAIFCRREVVIGPLKLPKIDLLGRVLACVFGILFITPAMASCYFDTTIGLYRFSQKPSSISPEKNSSWFVSEALAKDQGTLLQSFEIKENHVIKLGDNIGDGELCFYVGDIKLKKASTLIVYKLTKEYANETPFGKEIKEKKIERILKIDDIVVEATVKEGNDIKFKYKNTRYNIRISKVIWLVFGSNFMEIQISEI